MTTKSQASIREDHAVLVHACNLRDTPVVAREQSIFAPKRIVSFPESFYVNRTF